MSSSKAAAMQRGVVVEFDFAVLSGHALLLEACKERLAKDGVKLDAPTMARRMNGKSFTAAVNAVCRAQGKALEDVPAVVSECNAAFAAALAKSVKDGGVPAAFVALVKALVAKGLKVVLISRVDGEALLPLFGELEEGRLVVYPDVSHGFGFLNWDQWRRAARKNTLHERFCAAVAGCGFSVKGALTSGMGVISKENELTAYQDMSGCDAHIVAFDNELVSDVCRIVQL